MCKYTYPIRVSYKGGALEPPPPPSTPIHILAVMLLTCAGGVISSPLSIVQTYSYEKANNNKAGITDVNSLLLHSQASHEHPPIGGTIQLWTKCRYDMQHGIESE